MRLICVVWLLQTRIMKIFCIEFQQVIQEDIFESNKSVNVKPSAPLRVSFHGFGKQCKRRWCTDLWCQVLSRTACPTCLSFYEHTISAWQTPSHPEKPKGKKRKKIPYRMLALILMSFWKEKYLIMKVMETSCYYISISPVLMCLSFLWHTCVPWQICRVFVILATYSLLFSARVELSSACSVTTHSLPARSVVKGRHVQDLLLFDKSAVAFDPTWTKGRRPWRDKAQVKRKHSTFFGSKQSVLRIAVVSEEQLYGACAPHFIFDRSYDTLHRVDGVSQVVRHRNVSHFGKSFTF